MNPLLSTSSFRHQTNYVVPISGYRSLSLSRYTLGYDYPTFLHPCAKSWRNGKSFLSISPPHIYSLVWFFSPSALFCQSIFFCVLPQPPYPLVITFRIPCLQTRQSWLALPVFKSRVLSIGSADWFWWGWLHLVYDRLLIHCFLVGKLVNIRSKAQTRQAKSLLCIEPRIPLSPRSKIYWLLTNSCIYHIFNINSCEKSCQHPHPLL